MPRSPFLPRPDRYPIMNKTLLLILALISLALASCGDGSTKSTPADEQATTQERHADDEHDESERADAAVTLTAEQIRNARIETAQAGPAHIREHLPLYGEITPNAEHVREVTARYPGTIRSVARKVGDPVKQGDALATIESNESLQAYTLTAPLTGVVTARTANPGEQAGEKPLFTVADLSSVWVELSLFPRDAGKVRVGQSVRVKSEEAGLAGEGEVTYVSPIGSTASQTLTARVLLDNTARQWAPGLYVTAEVSLTEVEVPIAIRTEALQTMEGRTVVFAQENQQFVSRQLRLGRTDGEYQEVLEGIAAGESYVTRNSFILKAELGKGEAGHED